ncbi:MAG TPA: ATP-binding protein [Acetobacteraceae bacterium]|nr:ATP-binding protein [Acetobacteraceae bacterium]
MSKFTAGDDLLGMALESVPMGFLLLDGNHRLVQANEALLRIIGRMEGLAPGARADRLFAPEAWSRIAQELALTGRTGARRFAARFAATAERGEIEAHIVAQTLRAASGKPGMLLLWVTETPRPQAFTAELAHDLNNLLTAIAGAGALILARDADSATLGNVREILAGTDRGTELVRQVLASGDPQPSAPQATPITPSIGALAPLLRRLLGSQVALALALEEPGPVAEIAPAALDRVLINLAINARDAMQEGGQLFVRSGTVALAQPLAQRFETVPPGRYARIELTDTGKGIAPEILPRIFDPSFTTRRAEGGNGLGLASVRGLVRRARGFITVESEPGRGSCFRVYLPCSGAAAPLAGPAPDPSPPEAAATAKGPRRALLVEDEPTVGRVAELALRQGGWEVHLAESADSVLANLGQLTRPDVLVSDMAMPGMDGPTLVRILRTHWPGLPAILVSGYAENGGQDTFRDEGIAFLPKPYRLASLLSLMAEAAQTMPAPNSLPNSLIESPTGR